MIIDADTHISPYREGIRITGDKLLSLMDQSGVDKALCWLQEPYMRVVEESNAYVYQNVKKHPDRLIGFGWIDPHFPAQQCMDELKRCIEEYGVPGFKMNGCQNQFFVDDDVMATPYIEQIARHGKILALHVGSDAFDAASPFRVETIARRFPEMTILMVHMGGVGVPDMSRACIDVAARNPNIHLIGSHADYTKIQLAIRTLGAERVSFGSDSPFGYMHSEVAAYQAFLDDLFTPAEKALVMGGNICRLLHLGT